MNKKERWQFFKNLINNEPMKTIIITAKIPDVYDPRTVGNVIAKRLHGVTVEKVENKRLDKKTKV